MAVDGAIHERLVAMTVDFGRLWADPATSNRDRKRMLAYLIEDVTLIKVESEGIINIHVRFKGGRTRTLTVPNPKTSAQKVATSSVIVSLIDRLLDDHIYPEIAEILNELGLRPGGSARAGHTGGCFRPKRVAYVVHTYGLRDRYDRLRDRGMLTGSEITERLGIHDHTLNRWAKHGIVRRHAVNGHYYLYEDPGPNGPQRSPGRWNRLADRAVGMQKASIAAQLGSDLPEEV